MVGDPIADMITRINNAAKVGKDSVTVPFSKIKLEIANLLKTEGYLSKVDSSGKDKIPSARRIQMDLAYVVSGNDAFSQKSPRVHGVERVSKPSRRIYVSANEIKSGSGHAKGGKGLLVLSTTAGIVSGKIATEKGLGGELLFKIW